MTGESLNLMGENTFWIDDQDAVEEHLGNAKNEWRKAAIEGAIMAEQKDLQKYGEIYPRQFSSTNVFVAGLTEHLYRKFGEENHDDVYKNALNIFDSAQQHNTWAFYAQFAIALANRGNIEQADRLSVEDGPVLEDYKPFVDCAIAEQYALKGNNEMTMKFLTNAYCSRGGSISSRNLWAYNKVLSAKVKHDLGQTDLIGN